MKSISLIMSILIVFTLGARELKISSLNIRVYGLGGMYSGTLEDEFRNKWLSEYIDLKLHDSDVIAFQEIIDKERFIDEVIGDRMNCVSYDTESERHIHVVICYKKKYKFLKEESEDNFAYEPMAMKKYRPAVYGILSHHGKKLAHIVALHLKAHPKGHTIRTKQVKILSGRLKELKDNLPIIITGDYNTYNTEEVDDYTMINKFLNPINIIHADIDKLTSYKTPFFEGSFDHFWISNSIDMNFEFQVHGPCAVRGNDNFRYNNLYFYNQFISDHCPVSLTINL